MRGTLARLVPGAGADRRAVAALTVGHAGADLFLGAVPALIPFFVTQRGFSYADAGLLVLAGSLASSITQPLAGLVGDRLQAAWLPPLGLVLAAAGLFAATAVHGFAAIAAALLVGGLGVAIFHPESVRAARDAGGTSPGAALGVFALGGNVGFALGPALAVPLAAGLGFSAAGAVALVPLAAALVLVVVPRTAPARSLAPGVAGGDGGDLRTFWLVTGAAVALSAVIFGLMAFVPSWFAADLGSTVRLGSAAVVAMLVAGAVGTYAGGRLSDEHGRHRVVVAALAALVPLTLALPLAPPALALVLLVAIGLAMEGAYYPLLMAAQDALPHRPGLASGVVLGLSVGGGAAATSLLGRLVDAHGVPAALWACAGLAALALALAVLAGGHGARRTAPVASAT